MTSQSPQKHFYQSGKIAAKDEDDAPTGSFDENALEVDDSLLRDGMTIRVHSTTKNGVGEGGVVTSTTRWRVAWPGGPWWRSRVFKFWVVMDLSSEVHDS
ncbi:hypothetical protein VNO78_01406 [Psophocarpus tetragonolobus]|uniref:Uncharacterized protein n=1 Tax=Psophocarpus tetragonolobus TaxID=3891 RepID=A0AAN9XUM6_PSOTE